MLSDLIFVLRYIKSVLEEFTLPDLYQQFESTLQQISTASTPELQAQLNDIKTKIKAAHEKLNPVEWSYTQTKIFQKFGAEAVLGQKGWDAFSKALTENSANVPGAIAELDTKKQTISQILTNVTSVLSSLGELAEELETEEGKSVIQIVFDEKVPVDTLIDLKNQAEDWNNIIRAYSLLCKEAPEKITIIATSKGSPLSIWLLAPPLVSKALFATISPFIELYKETLEARKKSLELEKMRMAIKAEDFHLFETIDKYERLRISEIMTAVSKIRGQKDISESEVNEAKVALDKAGPMLYEFIKNGGKVDTSKDGEDRKAFSNFQLESNYREVRVLRNEVQVLLSERIAKHRVTKGEKKAKGKKESGKDKGKKKLLPEGGETTNA